MTTSPVRSNVRKHPDEVWPTGAQQPVRITLMNPNKRIRIGGRTVRVGDIPLSLFTMNCGHKAKGIAVAVGDTMFCVECQDDRRVVASRG